MEWAFLKKEQAIEYFTPLVNAQIGQGDKNKETISFMKSLLPLLQIKADKNRYLAFIIAPDFWGDKELSVVSLYIAPEKRKNHQLFREIMQDIFKLAAENNCRYVSMGSHLKNKNKFFKFLRGIGFSEFIFRKEL